MNARGVLRDVLAQLLHLAGASNLERVCRGKLLILTFHRVLPAHLRAQYPLPGLAVTPEELTWILSSLVRSFELHTVSDAVQRLHEGPISRPLLAVSFDDGQVDNLRYGAPVLGELGIPATFYIPTGYIASTALLWHDAAGFAWQAASIQQRLALINEMQWADPDASLSVQEFLESLKQLSPSRRDEVVAKLTRISNVDLPEWSRLMTWEEVAELASAGHEIGSHGRSHALLPQLTHAEQEQEIAGSMQDIVTHLGALPRSMCYPNGSYDAKSVALGAQAGYENGVTTDWGINTPLESPFELMRCDMDAARLLNRHGALSKPRLAMRLAGLQPGLSSRSRTVLVDRVGSN